MWQLSEPKPVKLICGILACDSHALQRGRDSFLAEFGQADFLSEIWPFTQTQYYKDQTGTNILRQFVAIADLIDPGRLAAVKHKTNQIEQDLAKELPIWPRPVNLDPGLLEPSKLILASTKNFSHRVYIGDKIYAEVTLLSNKGTWRFQEYTYPDYKQTCYQQFFSKVKKRLVEQQKEY